MAWNRGGELHAGTGAQGLCRGHATFTEAAYGAGMFKIMAGRWR